MSAFIENLQKELDDKTLNPDNLSNEQKAIIDELIRRKKLTGPTMGELSQMRTGAAEEVAREK